jgi:hypothetical protein
MKTIVSNSFKRVLPVALICVMISVSCKRVFDVQPETTLNSTQVYRNVYDADAAVLGLYGKLMGVAKQYVVLNELRADLMEVTANADDSLKQINTHSVLAGNPYANPRLYYSLINDCNDVLRNFKIMLATNKFKVAEYNQRYSDVGAIRSWLYLQVGIHFGKVPYVTDPLETIDDVRDASKYPLIPFSQLLDSLINFTQSLPYQLPYSSGSNLLIAAVDGYNTQSFFIEKNGLLGDLNLWKGNYNAAAGYYRLLMESTGYTNNSVNNPAADQYFQQFKQAYASVADNKDLCVGYVRYHEMDIYSLIENNSQGWRSMFARGQDNLFYQQMIWVLPFSSSFAPVNPFIDLFSNNGGRYLVKPSQQAMDNWNSQLQTNGFPFDARGNFTWKTINGQPVIMKYLYQYVDGSLLLPVNLLTKNGEWFLNRASAVHLHFAEAANRDGRHRLAYAFVNGGIDTAYGPAGNVDVTPYENTLYEPFPYNFDARNGTYPNFRGPWYRNAGIRGCARLNLNTVTGDSTLSIENSILSEGALELAYEGYRWPDLLRIALRRNDPGIIANAIFNKLSKDGNPQAAAVRAKLMDPNNWYLPFKW